MRPVVLYSLLSLDGVAEDPDDWLFTFDQVLLDNLAEVIAEQDDVLLGRRMFQEWAAYWPTAQDEPFASFINAVPKHVAARTAPAGDWGPRTVIDGPAADYVEQLKQSEGRAIGIHGSIQLAQSLLASEVVDELRLVVAPTTAGRGRRLFGESALQRWRLVSSVAAPSGALALHYRHTPGE